MISRMYASHVFFATILAIVSSQFVRFISILPRNRATIFRLREPLNIISNIKVRLVNYTILY